MYRVIIDLNLPVAPNCPGCLLKEIRAKFENEVPRLKVAQAYLLDENDINQIKKAVNVSGKKREEEEELP